MSRKSKACEPLQTMSHTSSLAKYQKIDSDIISAVLSKYNEAAKRKKEFCPKYGSIWGDTELEIEDAKKISNIKSVYNAGYNHSEDSPLTECIDTKEVDFVEKNLDTSVEDFKNIKYEMKKDEDIFLSVKTDKHNRIPPSMCKRSPEDKFKFSSKTISRNEILLSDCEDFEEMSSSRILNYMESSIEKIFPIESDTSCKSDFIPEKKSEKETILDNRRNKVKGDYVLDMNDNASKADKENWRSRSYALNKPSSLPKSKMHKKSFEEWSKERKQLNKVKNVKLDSTLQQDIALQKVLDNFHEVQTHEDVLDMESESNSCPSNIKLDLKMQQDIAIQKVLDNFHGVLTDEDVLDMESEFDSYLSNSSESRNTQISLNEMIHLEVSDETGKIVGKLPILYEELLEMQNNYPEIYEILPDADKHIKALHSASAVVIFLRCIFGASYTIPNWEVAVEAYGIANKYGISNLIDRCKSFFKNNAIPVDDFPKFSQVCNHFGVQEALKNVKTDATRFPFYKNVKHIFHNCTVSGTIYREPSTYRESEEYCLPLLYGRQDGLGSMKMRDQINNFMFESLSGIYDITGIQIKLETAASVINKELHINYDVYNVGKGNFEFQNKEIDIEFQSTVIINFDEALHVKPRDKYKISIQIDDVYPVWCYYITENKLEAANEGVKFCITFESDIKSVFIEKLLYIIKR